MLKLAVFSDIHLGNKRNRTETIIENLNKALPDNSQTADLDIIFLAGDIFDCLLELNSELIPLIDLWIDRLLRLCSKHSILLRVLEGTPSHDWKQSERFNTILNINKVSIDFKYVKALSIEHIPKFDINVLYVPDEWDTTTQGTQDQVVELLKVNKLSKVDYAIMHGSFGYQLPAAAKNAPRHDEKFYLAIVKYLIFIGHVHVNSKFDRIYAQGSFDRLSHGEEAPKGHYRATVYNENRHEISFVENKGARKYITIDCDKVEMDRLFDYIKPIVDTLPDDSCVRMKASSLHPIFQDMNSLIRMYPTVIWSKLIKDIEEEETVLNNTLESEEVTYTPITIDKNNVEGLLLERIKKLGYDQDFLIQAQHHLQELI